MTGHVTCFGEVLLRFATPAARITVQCDALDMVVGGAEANVAAGLASLGHSVRMVTRLPSSPLGDKARAALGGAGIDTTHVARAPGRMGLYFLESGAGLRPSSITYDRAGSLFASSCANDFDFASALKGSRLLHLSGITPALGLGGVALAQAAVAAANAESVPICFDGNYRALLWDAWDSDPCSILTDLMQSATVMIGNHRDISLLLNKPFSGDGPERRREAALAAFDAFPKLQLIASTARHIVTSSHHRIAARIDARDAGHQTAEVDVTGIVDRIGTGDAFAAGVLHKWLEGADIAATARAGLAYTVLKHTQPGDMCLIGPGELDAFSASGGDVRR
ncbi:2-keto-3-deoxygluconate kinase [Novosphingobium barchaimii LL02]|uniref:2-keto-3-deoxygluconate kinase n=1 Tax=Novosphingobium barchaimii LL02 TaxID=1114963 RepID=A0A0J7XYA3_9SPHN|nr:sugar kinase [Novosphingobium barchaimii]KMS56238.1 2-keto-3-deoxygluconate kinase [Novosphingobium barchaimii LL02]